MSVVDRLGRRRSTIILLALVSVTLLTIDLRGSSVINGVRRSAVDVLSPVRGVGAAVARPVRNVWQGVFNYDELKRENQRLKDQVDRQEAAAIASEAQVREYQELLAINKLPSIANIPYVNAQVVSRPLSNFDLTIEINQGSRQGVRIGMPVVTSAGLVGRITQVTEHRSTVRLLSDPELFVGVKIVGPQPPPTTAPPLPSQIETTTTTAPPPPSTTVAPPPTPTTAARGRPGATTTAATTTVPPTTAASIPPTAAATPVETAPTTTAAPVVRELGIMHGEGRDRSPSVDYVDTESSVQAGDAVVTSGVGQSLLPPDIPVGRVASVRRVAGSFQLDVTIDLAAELESLVFVRVLLYTPEL